MLGGRAWSKHHGRLAPFLVAIVSLWMDVAILQGDVAFGDTGEAQTVPFLLGIMHPPCFPAYVLLGYGFAQVFALGSIAWRMSLLSALAITGAALCLQRIVAREFDEPWIGGVAAVLFVATPVVWVHATRAGPDAVAFLFAVVALTCASEWYRFGKTRDAALSALGAGLALATHPWTLFVMPAVVLLLACGWSRARRPGTIVATVASFALGLAPFAYLPLRSAQAVRERLDPALALGLGPSTPYWNDGNPGPWQSFINDVTSVPPSGTLAATFAGLLHVEHAGAGAHDLLDVVMVNGGLLVLVLALLGTLALVRSALLATALLLGGFAVTPFALAERAGPDWQAYLLVTIWTLVLLAGCGAAGLSAEIRRRSRRWQLSARVALCLALLAGANGERTHVPEYEAANADPAPRQFLTSIAALAPPDAILVAERTYASPLAYAAYAEGSLSRRIVVMAAPDDPGLPVATWAATRCVLLVSGRGDLSLAAAPVDVRRADRRAFAPFVFVAVPRGGTDRCTAASP